MLTLTEAAIQKVVSIMEAQGRLGDGLRLAIAGRSSTGFRYSLGLVEEVLERVFVNGHGRLRTAWFLIREGARKNGTAARRNLARVSRSSWASC